MSSHYPAGSMRGSGIYSADFTMDVSCQDECKWFGVGDVQVNDWGTGTWVCPECLTEHEIEIEIEDGPDPDEAYDRMRDERDGFY